MKLIVGLGNPGPKYDNTRHNVGFMAIDYLAEQLNLKFSIENKLEGMIATFNQGSEKIIVLKPLTYMNLSGTSIRRTMDYYKISLEDVIIVVDDIYLDVGSIRLREKGSHGGHNGLKSIQRYVYSMDYKRIKIGIGNDDSLPLDHYVLSKFSKSEKEQIDQVIYKTYDALMMFASNTFFTDVMTKHNTQTN